MAPIFVGRGWSRVLRHLFYTRLHPASPAVRPFTYSAAAATNRIDRLAFFYSVYGGDGKPWHSSPSVSGVVSASQMRSAVDGAFTNEHVQALRWLVDKHGASKVLGMINTPTAPTCPLIEATHWGRKQALQWWLCAARQLDGGSLIGRLVTVTISDRQQRQLSQVSFEVVEAAMRTTRAPLDCLSWWVCEYLPHHQIRSEVPELMFSYLQFCIEFNQATRVDWWIKEDLHLFTHALELDSSLPLDYLTVNEQLLLDTLLSTHFSLPDSNSNAPNTDGCSFTYVIDSPHFRPRFKLALAYSLVNRANAFAPVLTWWLTQSTTAFHLPAGTIDNLAATAHSEIDALDALRALADSYPLDESAAAVDLASELGYDLVCEWWATYRGSIKYSHRALEQAVAKGMALVVEFWLVSGLPLKWRGSILEWAGKYAVEGWAEEIRRLWREYGKEVQGTVPWDDADVGESGL